jgi:hypothetical protein
MAFSDDLHEFEISDAIFQAQKLGDRLRWSLDEGAIDALASHIIVLDARAAARPEVLDGEDVRVLYRNLFLTVVLLATHERLRLNDDGGALHHIIHEVVINGRDRWTFERLGAFGVLGGDLMFYRQLALFGHFMV